MTLLDAFPRVTPETGDERLDLTHAERAHIRALAEELAAVPPGLLDDPEWVACARRLSCHLPTRLMEAIRDFRHDSGAQGALVIGNLPVEENELPETPGVPQSVERIASVHAAVSMLIGIQLGEIVAYREEKQGALVQNVVPVPGFEGSQSNAGSVPLEFHVENAFHPQRPDFVGLMCLRSDHLREAGTLVSSIRHALALIDQTDRKVLREPRFVTMAPPSFKAAQYSDVHPVLSGCEEDPDVILDFNATLALDDEAQAVLGRLRHVMDAVTTSVFLQPGDMVFVDNRIALHGRTDFTPRYDGRDRWLFRVYVHLDNRRSRPYRPDNTPVMD